jgi:adenosylcobinamide kinase / adenosylcobinamide-phosphate guanylyltransferase
MPDESGRRIVLLLGGVRSGKSRYAQEIAMRGQHVAFLATAEAGDDEMRLRIDRHRRERPAAWTTFEVPVAIEMVLQQCSGQFDTILIDCLTVWTANLMEHYAQDPDLVLAHAGRLATLLRRFTGTVILVSNEVGSGIVPDNELARNYRDLLGGINQRIAAAADEVILMVAGCPLVIKQPTEVPA